MTRTTLARLRIPVVMSDILPVIAILALLLGGALYVARKQARDYKA
jgi:hypothetical protein